jgi:hypothetical protein
MRNYVEKLEETECDFVDYGKNEVKFYAFKKISRLEMVFNKAKQDTTICVYCVLIFLVIRLNYHLLRINLDFNSYIVCLQNGGKK